MYALFFLSSLVFFYGGLPFFKGIARELKQNNPGMMTLVVIAGSIVYLYSLTVVLGFSGKIFFGELTIFMDIMLFGHWMETKSMFSMSHSLDELIKLLPKSAHKIMPEMAQQIVGETMENRTKEIPLNKLKIKDIVFIKPGEKIPADGKIIKGSAVIDEFLFTGESRQISKDVGDYVIGGSTNGNGEIQVEISQIGEKLFIYQIVNSVLKAQESRLQTKDFADGVAFWLTIISLILGVFTLFYWIFFSISSFAFGLEKALAVMMVASPQALGLAIPLVIATVTAYASRRGLFIRNWTAFEKAKDVKYILFDKTGTLIKSQFGVTNVILFDRSFDERMILCYASAVERNSEHPIGRAIFSSVCEMADVQNFKSLPSGGVEGIVHGRNIKVVNQNYLKELNKEVTNKELVKYFEEGKTIVFVMVDDEVMGAIAMSDTLKEESVKIIEKLKKIGIRTVMLTEDNEKSASYIAKKLGVDDYFFNVTPEEKVKKVKEVQAKGISVAMVGDGIKDALALKTANVGIAIGAGTNITLESADIVLVGNNLFDVLSVLKLSKNSYGKMRQNLILVVVYNILMIPLAIGVLDYFGIAANLALGSLFVTFLTLMVAVNTQFLRV